MSSATVRGWTARIALSCLVVCLVTSSVVAGVQPAARVPVPTTLPHQSLHFAYWSERDGYESRLVLSNAKGLELFVRPTIYDASGEALEFDAIRIEPGRPVSISIGDLIKGARVRAGNFDDGSLKLDFEAPDSGYVGAQVIVRHAESSLSFDVPAEMPMSFMSSRLEGIWRRAPDAESRVVLSNTSSTAQSGTVRMTGQRSRASLDREFNLKPHETQVFEVSNAEVAAVPSAIGEIGGIRILHSGDPGGVIAYGMVAAPNRGFSSSIRFDDPAAAVTQKFAAAHLMVGQPDLPGLPPAALFASLVALRNTSESPVTVEPRASFTANGSPLAVSLLPRVLLGGEIREINLNEELRAVGVRGPFRDVSLSLDASGARGALLARILCVDGSGTHVFEPPVKDTGNWMNRSGIYPFDLTGDERSIIHVKNTGGEVALFTVHMEFDGGSYALAVQSLEPYQERSFDIRELRDVESPDCTGRLIPKETESGRVLWNEFNRKALIGRVEQYSPSAGVSSSFSCGDPCRCGPNAANHWMTPTSGVGKVGDVTFMKFFMTTQDFDCYGSTEMGPFDITDAFTTWSSSNAAIAKIGPFVYGSGRKVTCMGPGYATVTANHSYFGYDGPDGNGDCFPVDESFSGQCPMTVNPGVSFGSVDAIGKDVAVDVFVFLDPSPSTVSVTLTLEPVPGMGTGSAKFDVNNSTTLTVTQSGNVKLKGVTPSSVLDNMRIRASANGMTIATETFTVVQVTFSIRTGGSSVVSMDNSARSYYNAQLGTFNLNTYKSSGAAPAQIWRTGVEVVATVTPSSYSGLVIQERQVVAFKRFDGTNALQQSGGPFPDPGDPGLRDDDPQSNASGGKTYDLDAPGLNLSTFPIGTTLRMRTNFIQWARSAQGYKLSADFSWYSRLSVTKTALGEVLQTSVANDNKAGAGTTILTWNLQ